MIWRGDPFELLKHIRFEPYPYAGRHRKPAPSSACPVCGRPIRVHFNGTRHRHKVSNEPTTKLHPWCAGGGVRA